MFTVTPAAGITYFCAYIEDHGVTAYPVGSPTSGCVALACYYGVSDPAEVDAYVGANTAPVISPTVGTIEYPSTLTPIVVSFGSITGDTYTVHLYSSPTDSCLGPFTGSPLATNSVTATGTSSSTSFSVPAVDSNMYLCAEVIDTGPAVINTGLWSGPASYVLVPALSSYINNDENTVSADVGATVTLTDYVSGGTTPYTYQWYTDTGPGASLGCLSANAISMATSNPYSFTAALPTGPQYFSVLVTDSSSPGGPSQKCELATVVVEGALEPVPNTADFTIDSTSGVISGQVGSPALQAVVLFVGGSPWYGVTIYSGTDSVCANDKTVVASVNDVNASEAILSFPEPSTPSSITYYCAVVTDATGNSVTLGPIQVDITPALSTPTMVISPTSIDYGNPTSLGYIAATVSWAGGNEPYYVVLTSGSQSSCAAPDNVPEYVLPTPSVLPTGSTGTKYTGTAVSGPNAPNTLGVEYLGLLYQVWYTSGTTMSFTLPVPSSTTYYCAIVFDSSAPQSQTYTAAGAEFLIEGLFAVNSPKLTSTLTEGQSPYYEGVPDTATVTWSGGSGPFVVTLYVDTVSNACVPADLSLAPVTPGSNPQTGVTGDSATFTFLAPTTPNNYWYCAVVVDSTGAVAANGALPLAPGAELSVSTPLAGATISITPSVSGADVGQTEPIKVTVAWSASTGSPPYSVSLYATAACTGTPVATESGISTNSYTFDLTSPSTTTTYCAIVTDSSVPVSTAMSTTATFTLNAPPSVGFAVASYEIAAGSSTTLNPIILSPGTNPDTLEYFIGSGCVAADLVYTTGSFTGVAGITPNTPSADQYNTGVISTTTTYSVLLTDSSVGTPAITSCASITVTVNNGPIDVAAVSTGSFAGLVYVTNPTSAGSGPLADSISVIDTDSNAVTQVTLTTLPAAIDGVPAGTAINPWGVAVDAGTGLVFFTGTATSGHTTIGVVCTMSMATNIVTACAQAGTSPEGVAVNTAFGQVFVANSGDDTVSVFTEALVPVTTVAVGPAPMFVAVDQSTYTVYVTDNGGNTISVLQPRLGGGFAVTTVTVGFEPVGVAVDPLTDYVWVANSGSGTVSVLSGSTYNTLQTIKVGGNPTGIAISDANGMAYVANAATNTVTPISLSTYAPGTPIAVGSDPFGVATFLSSISGIPSLAYVANSGSNFVSVIDLATGAVIATIVVP